jgi:hypothetical protein
MCCIRSVERPRAVRIGSFSAHSSTMRFLYSRSRLSVTRGGCGRLWKKSGGSRRAKMHAYSTRSRAAPLFSQYRKSRRPWIGKFLPTRILGQGRLTRGLLSASLKGTGIRNESACAGGRCIACLRRCARAYVAPLIVTVCTLSPRSRSPPLLLTPFGRRSRCPAAPPRSAVTGSEGSPSSCSHLQFRPSSGLRCLRRCFRRNGDEPYLRHYCLTRRFRLLRPSKSPLRRHKGLRLQ